jgi:hypothetical protein
MHCPACDSENLSEEVDYASFENHARFRDWEPGILQWKDLALGAERARFCLDCGYLLLFAGAAKLAKLKAGRPKT